MLWLHVLSTRTNWVAHINWMNGKKSAAVVRRCSVKKVLLKISQDSQEKPEACKMLDLLMD